MNLSHDDNPPSPRVAVPHRSGRSLALGTAALVCGLVPLAAAILSVVLNATEGEGHRSPPGTIVITLTDVVSLGLFFIGAPLGGIASLFFAWCNAASHRDRDRAAFARGLNHSAVVSTLLGWAACAWIVCYVMLFHRPR